jgi:PPK2 family polyphosphate:nucleotide phosphotransferase
MSWAKKLSKPYRIVDDKDFRLKDFDPSDTGDIHSKEQADELLQKGIAAMTELQDKLYAQDRWGVLLMFQAMDAAGKDGAIKHVMSGVNPQGCQVFSFKHPSDQELQHDFLWRTTRDLPERGKIGIFNRSYYEEVLIAKVHPAILKAEQVPEDKAIWEDRYQSIRNLERHLYRNGTRIIKFFLHLSKEEQRRRFLSRLENPEKNWKFSLNDIQEREYWKDYRKAYEGCLSATSTDTAPWYIVPADHKPDSRLIISSIISETMEKLKMAYPQPDKAKRKELEEALRLLKKQGEKRERPDEG